MEKWIRAPNYIGETYYDYFVLLGQNRDSDLLTRSNFQVALEKLGGEGNGVLVIRSYHWAVVWVEFIGIHESALDKIEIAKGLENSLIDYLILDKDHYFQMEYDEIHDYWERASLQERIEQCTNAKAPIFAARHDRPTKKVFDYLRYTWH